MEIGRGSVASTPRSGITAESLYIHHSIEKQRKQNAQANSHKPRFLYRGLIAGPLTPGKQQTHGDAPVQHFVVCFHCYSFVSQAPCAHALGSPSPSVLKSPCSGRHPGDAAKYGAVLAWLASFHQLRPAASWPRANSAGRAGTSSSPREEQITQTTSISIFPSGTGDCGTEESVKARTVQCQPLVTRASSSSDGGFPVLDPLRATAAPSAK